MTGVRIYQPAPSAMQTGPSGVGKWVLVYEPGAAKDIDPLTGWVGSSDTRSQVRLKFGSKDRAVAFAERNKLSYQACEPNARRFKIKNYADNFSFHQVK